MGCHWGVKAGHAGIDDWWDAALSVVRVSAPHKSRCRGGPACGQGFARPPHLISRHKPCRGRGPSRASCLPACTIWLASSTRWATKLRGCVFSVRPWQGAPVSPGADEPTSVAPVSAGCTERGGTGRRQRPGGGRGAAARRGERRGRRRARVQARARGRAARAGEIPREARAGRRRW